MHPPPKIWLYNQANVYSVFPICYAENNSRPGNSYCDGDYTAVHSQLPKTQMKETRPSLLQRSIHFLTHASDKD